MKSNHAVESRSFGVTQKETTESLFRVVVTFLEIFAVLEVPTATLLNIF